MQKKPTIHELEDILREKDPPLIEILATGEVRAVPDEVIRLRAQRDALVEALEKLTTSVELLNPGPGTRLSNLRRDARAVLAAAKETP